MGALELLTVHEDKPISLYIFGGASVYFGVAYGNCQWSSVGFTTNMRYL